MNEILESVDITRLREATPISVSDFKKVVNSLPDPFEYYKINGPSPCFARLIDKIEVPVDHTILQMATGIESVKKAYYRDISFTPQPPGRDTREWHWKANTLLIIE